MEVCCYIVFCIFLVINFLLDELKNFRQWDSKTPGHPEYGDTEGVETTTGPLGQGLNKCNWNGSCTKASCSRFNKRGFKLFDHHIYVEAGDGDLMEGISHEASSFAGHNKLGKVNCFL